MVRGLSCAFERQFVVWLSVQEEVRSFDLGVHLGPLVRFSILDSMCTYIYIHVHVRIHAYIHTCTGMARIHKCMYIHAHACHVHTWPISTHPCTYMPTHVYTCVYRHAPYPTNTCTCVPAYVLYAYTYVFVHAYIRGLRIVRVYVRIRACIYTRL
jgi:hypothetical protein